MQWSTSRVVLVTLVLSCISIGLGIIIGFFGITSSDSSDQSYVEDTSIIAKLMNEISADNIRDNLRELTRKPHIAGREQDEVVLVKWIRDRWTSSGFDSVRVYSYDILLSYPNQTDSNYVAVVDTNGVETDISQRQELVIDPEQNDPNVVDPFNAYSSGGIIEGDPIYVNYATVEDFMFLNRTINLDINDKICIAKYGKIFRGDKARLAQEYGCKGLILFSDPADYTVPWDGVYPNGTFLPPTGVQRGTLWSDNGDPRTPNYPSISSAWHVPNEDLNLPKIPVTPIGSIDAEKYLAKMGGNEVIETWKGGLNITYRYGPGFNSPYSSSKIKLYDRTSTEVVTTNNVIGFIKGSVEPDRYVLIGNHRDAWVFGAIDPTSGTAVEVEIARAFGEMLKQGWRPRRTLVFCSWGAEEYGLIGSTEWVEELQKELQSRAVAYLNLDIAVNGNYSFNGNGVSSLRNMLYDATKHVRNPDQSEIDAGRSTVYDTWSERFKQPNLEIPSYSSVGSGSDYTAFLQVIGVPVIDMTYTYDRSIGIASYPVYHSVYETFQYVTTYIDPDFKIHRATAQVLAEAARDLSASVILPIDCRLYAEYLADNQDSLIDGYGQAMMDNGIDLTQLNDSINTFANAADDIHKRISAIDQKNVLDVRMINDQLMQLERSFIDQNPLLGRVSYRHVISAPSQFNAYGNTAFPGITDALFDIDNDPDQAGRWSEVKRQYSIVVFHILSAAASLGPVVP